MIREIMLEFKHWLWLVVIIALGMCFCDWGNKEAIHNYAVYESQFCLNPQEGTGWIDSVVDKTKLK